MIVFIVNILNMYNTSNKDQDITFICISYKPNKDTHIIL